MGQELKRLLYVEDDEDIAELTQSVLENICKLEVVHCQNGTTAVPAFESFQPQLILLDVMMPEMDGPTTLKKVRELPGGKNIPIVFLTARAQLHQQQEYLELGAAKVLTKPFMSAELCSTLCQIWAEYHQ